MSSASSTPSIARTTARARGACRPSSSLKARPSPDRAASTSSRSPISTRTPRLVALSACEVTPKFKPSGRGSDQGEMRAALWIVVLVAALAVLAGARQAFPHARGAGRDDFSVRLDRVAQAISGRHDVSVRCGETADPSILGTVLFYGDVPGREALLAPH